MSESQTAFLSYIDEIAIELSTAQAAANLQVDIEHSIRNLDQLAKLTQQCPPDINLYQTKNLLSLDRGLYEDLIRPALLKRLATSIG